MFEKLHFIYGIVQVILDNKDLWAEFIVSITGLLSVVHRIFPSANKTGFLSKLDALLNRIYDLLKVPNPVKANAPTKA